MSVECQYLLPCAFLPLPAPEDPFDLSLSFTSISSEKWLESSFPRSLGVVCVCVARTASKRGPFPIKCFRAPLSLLLQSHRAASKLDLQSLESQIWALPFGGRPQSKPTLDKQTSVKPRKGEKICQSRSTNRYTRTTFYGGAGVSCAQ